VLVEGGHTLLLSAQLCPVIILEVLCVQQFVCIYLYTFESSENDCRQSIMIIVVPLRITLCWCCIVCDDECKQCCLFIHLGCIYNCTARI
jgi:hypothetical protein